MGARSLARMRACPREPRLAAPQISGRPGERARRLKTEAPTFNWPRSSLSAAEHVRSAELPPTFCWPLIDTTAATAAAAVRIPLLGIWRPDRRLENPLAKHARPRSARKIADERVTDGRTDGQSQQQT